MYISQYHSTLTHHEHGQEDAAREDNHDRRRHGVSRPALPHRVLAHKAARDTVSLLPAPELRPRLLLLLEVEDTPSVQSDRKQQIKQAFSWTWLFVGTSSFDGLQ